MKPMPPFFFIRIPKKEQVARREKLGSLYLPFNKIYMTRERQYGEIIAIGADAAREFPEAKIGMILIHHHFVTGKEMEGTEDNTHLFHEDKTYKYYTVTAFSINGRANETYGVYDGHKIITHPTFIFLEPDKPAVNNLSPDQFISSATKKEKSGLILFKNWNDDRKTIYDRIEFLKNEITQLCKTPPSDILNKLIESKEREMEALAKKMNKPRYEEYTVAASNPLIEKWFNTKINSGDKIYCLNIASKTTIEFMGKEYRVVKITYIGFPHNFLKKAIRLHERKKLKTA